MLPLAVRIDTQVLHIRTNRRSKIADKRSNSWGELFSTAAEGVHSSSPRKWLRQVLHVLSGSLKSLKDSLNPHTTSCRVHNTPFFIFRQCVTVRRTKWQSTVRLYACITTHLTGNYRILSVFYKRCPLHTAAAALSTQHISASFACKVETKDQIKLGSETIISLSAAPLWTESATGSQTMTSNYNLTHILNKKLKRTKEHIH